MTRPLGSHRGRMGGSVGGSVLGKTLGFSLGLTLVFTLVANMLPQLEGEVPVEQEVYLSALTMDTFVALGERLFNGKGTCTLCHKPPPVGRAPDIQGEDMVALAGQRLADERYVGNAKEAVEYIRESMVDPSQYVVADWGKKGSDDRVSPMPPIDKPPICRPRTVTRSLFPCRARLRRHPNPSQLQRPAARLPLREPRRRRSRSMGVKPAIGYWDRNPPWVRG